MAEALAGAGVHRAWVVHGHGGLDELSLSGVNELWEVQGGRVERITVDALEYGLPRAGIEDLRGGDPQFNASVVQRVLDGEAGPVRNVVLFNSAAALVICGAASDLEAGIEMARRSIDSGAARGCLQRFIDASNEGAV
jgi:anthranilate phosphoribosyltransferase